MKQLQVLIKPASSTCNLCCNYCFYKDEASHREEENRGKMKKDVMEATIRKALSCSEQCSFLFQGGEPTLAGISFFREFTEEVNRQKKENQKIFYAIQTNGVSLNEEWIALFKENHFLVGVSLDGVRNTHDRNRLDAYGNGTFQRVFDHIKQMQEQKIDVNILCVLNQQTGEKIEAIYRFFLRKGFYYQQYIPCLDPLHAERGKEKYSLTPEMHLEALKKLFDLWFEDRRRGVYVSIRQFDNYLQILRGENPEACAMYGKCSMQNVIEADGKVYPCDFYALDEYCMGSILETEFYELQEEALEEKKGSFFEQSRQRDDRCPKCKWYPLCRGGCKRDCTCKDGQWKNYYCDVYQKFFEYAIGKLEWMASGARL